MPDPFVDQLAALCRAQPTRAKWVLVPTHHIGRTLGDRIALSGTDWLNLRFATPLDIALRMGAPFLVEHRIDPSEGGRTIVADSIKYSLKPAGRSPCVRLRGFQVAVAT